MRAVKQILNDLLRRTIDLGLEAGMCLCKLYVDSKGKHQMVMQDVAAMEAEKDGYFLADLFGVKHLFAEK
jgi:predicted RNA-binding protein